MLKRKTTWFVLVIVAIGVAYVRSARATPQNAGFMGKTVATSTFGELDINLHTIPADLWQARLKTKGLTDMYVQSNTWLAGGSTGWHTHPGPSLVVITSGTVTTYDGDDPTCTPTVYSANPGFPNSFVDPGGGHVHLVRNEDASIPASGYAVQLIPHGAARRIDAPNPGNCPAGVE